MSIVQKVAELRVEHSALQIRVAKLQAERDELQIECSKLRTGWSADMRWRGTVWDDTEQEVQELRAEVSRMSPVMTRLAARVQHLEHVGPCRLCGNRAQELRDLLEKKD